MEWSDPRTSKTADESLAKAPEQLSYSEVFRSRPQHAPVSCGSPDELQSPMIQTYSFMAHNWAQDWGFIGHKPSGSLLRTGLRPLPGPQVQLEQMELGSLSELLQREVGDSATGQARYHWEHKVSFFTQFPTCLTS